MKKIIISILIILTIFNNEINFANETEINLVNESEINPTNGSEINFASEIEEYEIMSYCSTDKNYESLEVLSKNTLNLNAKNAILYDRKCKRILFEKDAYKKVPNASTTKMLTAIVIYENSNLKDIVTISKSAANVAGSKVRFNTGDKISVNDLLNGMLLCSGNDAATALAEYCAGSVENFSEMLNDKAKEIGAMNTNFVTPHGLDDDNHYSTAYDLALIADYALDIPYLANIFSKTSETIYVNGIKRNVSTTNEMLHVYDKADGVKTGYTGKAGRCLVTSATNEDGWQLISVVLGCDTKNFRTEDSKKLLEYGFNNFKFINIGNVLPKKVAFEVEKSKEYIYAVDLDFDYEYPLTDEEVQKVYYIQTEIPKFIAPVEKNTEIAKYTIYVR